MVIFFLFEGLIPDDNELALLAALGNEDPGDESFEQLFTRLRLMKGKERERERISRFFSLCAKLIHLSLCRQT